MDPSGTLGFAPIVMVWLARIVLVALLAEMILPIFEHKPHTEPRPIDIPRPPKEPRPEWPRERGAGPRPPSNPNPPGRWRYNPRIRVENLVESVLV